MLQNINNRKAESSILNVGKFLISVNDRVIERPSRETVRIIDAMTSESNYLFEKCPQHYALNDSEARNVLSQGLTDTTLKCAAGFNMN